MVKYTVSDQCMQNLINQERERNYWKNVQNLKFERKLTVEEQFNRLKVGQKANK